MSRRFQVVGFCFAVILVGLSLTGSVSQLCEKHGIHPDGVQMADAVIGLAGLVPIVLLWWADQRREQKAGQRVRIVLVAEGGRKLILPYTPPRREINSRAGLFGALGGIAGARRFDLGHALLHLVSSDAYEAFCQGKVDSIEIPVPDREFEEFKLDAEAFERGELRKSPPPPAPKPAKELVEILERLTSLEEKISKTSTGEETPPAA